MRVLLVGGWADGNKRWAEKARKRFGVEVVGFWGEDKSKRPGKAPGGDFAAFFVMTDVCSHQYTDIAKIHAEKHGLGLYNVNTSITVSDGLLRKQGFPFPVKSTAAVASTKHAPPRTAATVWSQSEIVAIYHMRKQGITWKNVALAMGSKPDRMRKALKRGQSSYPKVLAEIDQQYTAAVVPPPDLPNLAGTRRADRTDAELAAALAAGPTGKTRQALRQLRNRAPNRYKRIAALAAQQTAQAPASDDVAEWAGLAEQYERERDKARAQVDDQWKDLQSMHAKVQHAERRAKAALAHVNDVDTARNVEAAATIKLQQDQRKAHKRVTQLTEANAELKAKVDELEARLSVATTPATIEFTNPPVNGFDRDAFRLGIDAALRATGGDTTTRALMQMAGFDL